MTPRQELVARMRAMAADVIDWDGDIMHRWDQIRSQVETHKGSDLPRLNFESLMEEFAELLNEGADALEAGR